MIEYTAEVELASRDFTDAALAAAAAALEGYRVVLTTSRRGRLSATITIPAGDLRQACTTALAVAATTGHEVIGVEVMATAEFDARAGIEHLPALVSITQAATALGVTRKAVIRQLERGGLGGQRVGVTWAIPRAALDARLALTARATEEDTGTPR